MEGRLGVGEGGGDDDDDEAPPTSPGQPERGGGNFRSALEEAGGGGGGCGPPSPPPLLGEGEVDPPRSLPSAGTDAFRILRLPEPEGKTGLGRGRHVGGRTPSARWGRGRALESRTRSGARDASHAQSRDARLDAGTPTFQRRRLGAAPGGVGERSPGTREKPPCPATPWRRGPTTPAPPTPPPKEGCSLSRASLREGGGLSGARVLPGQVKTGVTLPFPRPDPIVSVACGPSRLRNTC